jgi:hypothetical protein
MASILGSVTINQLKIVELDSFPNGPMPEIEVGDLVLINDTPGFYQKSGSNDSEYIRLDGWASTGVTVVSNSTLTLTGTSSPIRIFTGSVTGQIVRLPDISTIPVGHQIYIFNDSSQTISIRNFANTELYSMVSGGRALFILRDNSTEPGTWSYDATGAGAIPSHGATHIAGDAIPNATTIAPGLMSATDKTNHDNHLSNTSNPHSTTKSQVGLGNVDNTSDLDKPVSTATQTALNLKYDSSNPNGYETPSQLNTRDTNNRNRSNHTGSQLASTISDFASTVRSTVITGIDTALTGLITAADTILQALGRLQHQITNFKNNSFENYSVASFQTSSASLVAITSFTVTPNVAGLYNIDCYLTVSVNSNSTRDVSLALYKNGVAINNTTFVIQTSNSGVIRVVFSFASEVSLNGTTDNVQGYVSVSGTSTVTVTNRKIRATRVGA